MEAAVGLAPRAALEKARPVRRLVVETRRERLMGRCSVDIIRLFYTRVSRVSCAGARAYAARMG